MSTEEARDTIMRLSEMVDLIGLRTHIIEGTGKGRVLGPTAWHYTREYMQGYADPANTEAVISVFEAASVTDDIQAVRWLLRHDDLVL